MEGYQTVFSGNKASLNGGAVYFGNSNTEIFVMSGTLLQQLTQKKNRFAMSKCISCTDTITTLRLPIFLAIESRQIPLLWTWLNVESLGVLDIAVSRHSARKPWEKAVVNWFD